MTPCSNGAVVELKDGILGLFETRISWSQSVYGRIGVPTGSNPLMGVVDQPLVCAFRSRRAPYSYTNAYRYRIRIASSIRVVSRPREARERRGQETRHTRETGDLQESKPSHKTDVERRHREEDRNAPSNRFFRDSSDCRAYAPTDITGSRCSHNNVP